MRPLLQRVALLFGLGGLCLGAAVVLAAGRLGTRTADWSVAADSNPVDITGSVGLAGRAGAACRCRTSSAAISSTAS